jgi:hypothetical protein
VGTPAEEIQQVPLGQQVWPSAPVQQVSVEAQHVPLQIVSVEWGQHTLLIQNPLQQVPLQMISVEWGQHTLLIQNPLQQVWLQQTAATPTAQHPLLQADGSGWAADVLWSPLQGDAGAAIHAGAAPAVAADRRDADGATSTITSG